MIVRSWLASALRGTLCQAKVAARDLALIHPAAEVDTTG
jgi:hypothetical protein